MESLNIKQKYLHIMERRDRNKDQEIKSFGGSYFQIGKSREYPAAIFSHKSKTFMKNKRRGL